MIISFLKEAHIHVLMYGTHLYGNMHTPYPYEHFQEVGPPDLEIEEITVSTLMPRDISSTTERITALSYQINLEN